MKRKLLVVMGLLASTVFAEVKLQPIFGDNMVLQRNASTNFWGTASPDEEVAVTGSWGKSAKAATGQDGKWKVTLQTPEPEDRLP